MSRKEVRVTPTFLSDGNHGSRQHPEPAVNSQTLSHIYPELASASTHQRKHGGSILSGRSPTARRRGRGEDAIYFDAAKNPLLMCI